MMANNEVIETKKKIVSEIKEKIDNATSIVIFDYRGLTVVEISELRAQLKETGTELKIYKNTLSKRALDELEFDFKEYLVGPNAIAISENLIEPIKVLSEFAKKHNALEIKAGIVEGKIADIELIDKLSTIPSREGLLTMLAGGMIATVKDLAACLHLYAEEQGETEQVEEPKEAKEEPKEVEQVEESTEINEENDNKEEK